MNIINNSKQQFKPNIAIDMVAACLAHYKKFKRPVKSITLNEALWFKWKEGIQERADVKGVTFENYEEIEFRNVTIIKGSKFMTKNMTVVLKELILK